MEEIAKQEKEQKKEEEIARKEAEQQKIDDAESYSQQQAVKMAENYIAYTAF